MKLVSWSIDLWSAHNSSTFYASSIGLKEVSKFVSFLWRFHHHMTQIKFETLDMNHYTITQIWFWNYNYGLNFRINGFDLEMKSHDPRFCISYHTSKLFDLSQPWFLNPDQEVGPAECLWCWNCWTEKNHNYIEPILIISSHFEPFRTTSNCFKLNSKSLKLWTQTIEF